MKEFFDVRCNRGNADPSFTTRLRLFGDAAGRCQKPDCLQPVFIETESTVIYIAEVAHIISASADGPRSQAVDDEARRSYENLLLLCANCHTEIDKAEADYPEDLLQRWKSSHLQRVADTFDVTIRSSRAELRKDLEPLLKANYAVWDHCGPDGDHQHDPESPLTDQWAYQVLTTIIPNNRLILMILDANRRFLTEEEADVLAKFQLHVSGFEARHLGDEPAGGVPRFPDGMSSIVTGVG